MFQGGEVSREGGAKTCWWNIFWNLPLDKYRQSLWYPFPNPCTYCRFKIERLRKNSLGLGYQACKNILWNAFSTLLFYQAFDKYVCTPKYMKLVIKTIFHKHATRGKFWYLCTQHNLMLDLLVKTIPFRENTSLKSSVFSTVPWRTFSTHNSKGSETHARGETTELH